MESEDPDTPMANTGKASSQEQLNTAVSNSDTSTNEPAQVSMAALPT